MMKEIWRNKAKFDEYFRIKGWYLTGDTAYKDADGFIWYAGRGDDVIKTAGERVGPFEVESALIQHPAVAEAAVIGKPDELRGQIIKAFVTLRAGHTPSEELKKSIADFVKKNMAAPAAITMTVNHLNCQVLTQLQTQRTNRTTLSTTQSTASLNHSILSFLFS